MATKPGLTRRDFLRARRPQPGRGEPAQRLRPSRHPPTEAGRARQAGRGGEAGCQPRQPRLRPPPRSLPRLRSRLRPPSPQHRPHLPLPQPAEPKLGAHLIGKLEGPTVITDAAQMPKAFKEAPMLAELVKAGKLPPSSSASGQDPLVIKPVHEIGKYGGTWRRGFTGPADYWNGYRVAPAAPTTSCSGTTPARRSCRTSPRAGS